MGFQSVNEIDTFSFEDSQIYQLEIREGQITFELEALIVKPRNSQNTNYTESYAGTTRVRLEDATLHRAVREGYRYLDADGNLISEEPDVVLDEDEWVNLPKSVEGQYLFALEPATPEEVEQYGVNVDENKLYHFLIECVSEEAYDTTAQDSYDLLISFSKFIANWERFMNRVQR